MARKKTNDDWVGFLILLGVGMGAAVLYYTKGGRGPENDAALLPNDLEGRVDLVVAALNKRFGHRWVNWGLNVLQTSLQAMLPSEAVALVGVIYQVEQMAKSTPMSSYRKKQHALQMIQS